MPIIIIKTIIGKENKVKIIGGKSTRKTSWESIIINNNNQNPIRNGKIRKIEKEKILKKEIFPINQKSQQNET